MKLHNNQLKLIRHLVRFHSLDYESCLDILHDENTKDRIALSYIFRPLTKNKYISKNKNGIVSILKKGKELFPEENHIIASGSSGQAQTRAIQVSKMAALMEKQRVIISKDLPENDKPTFIPSACWRNITPGILSTTRFVGMLLAYGKKYAVYDIGDGTMEWQVRAESSLFYTKYGSYETKADGMILICDDDKRDKIAENIIRQTMWNRKTLLDSHYTERNKPVRFSKSPIRIRTQYEHVYLTTPKRLKDDLKKIYGEERIINGLIKDAVKCHDPKEGDVEVWPERYYINPAFDLLKLVYFFSAVKSLNDILNKGLPVSNIMYAIIMYPQDLSILRIYPDVFNSERVKFYEFKSDENR